MSTRDSDHLDPSGKLICTGCAKVISAPGYGPCHDCGGLFREATADDLRCDRCGDRRGWRLIDRRGDYTRLCVECCNDLDESPEDLGVFGE